MIYRGGGIPAMAPCEVDLHSCRGWGRKHLELPEWPRVWNGQRPPALGSSSADCLLSQNCSRHRVPHSPSTRSPEGMRNPTASLPSTVSSFALAVSSCNKLVSSLSLSDCLYEGFMAPK